MDLYTFCLAITKHLNPPCVFKAPAINPICVYIDSSIFGEKKWYKNYALSWLGGFWVSIALVTKWVITVWSTFNKEALIS